MLINYIWNQGLEQVKNKKTPKPTSLSKSFAIYDVIILRETAQLWATSMNPNRKIIVRGSITLHRLEHVSCGQCKEKNLIWVDTPDFQIQRHFYHHRKWKHPLPCWRQTSWQTPTFSKMEFFKVIRAWKGPAFPRCHISRAGGIPSPWHPPQAIATEKGEVPAPFAQGIS